MIWNKVTKGFTARFKGENGCVVIFDSIAANEEENFNLCYVSYIFEEFLY